MQPGLRTAVTSPSVGMCAPPTCSALGSPCHLTHCPPGLARTGWCSLLCHSGGSLSSACRLQGLAGTCLLWYGFLLLLPYGTACSFPTVISRGSQCLTITVSPWHFAGAIALSSSRQQQAEQGAVLTPIPACSPSLLTVHSTFPSPTVFRNFLVSFSIH